MNRREFLKLLSKASVAASLAGCSNLRTATDSNLYQLRPYGQARLLHFTDTHAQLKPVYFREPNVNLGLGIAKGKFPHLVGQNLLNALGPLNARDTHALTYLDFAEAAEKFGRVGGFAHLKTLIDQLRGETGEALLLDGGDTWQGSGTALWTQGQDMVEACNLLGVDVMTGHWEFTYDEARVLTNAAAFNGDFVAQNIRATEDAMFEGVPVFDEDSGHIFPPYSIKSLKGRRIAIIGQAFPYTPIANPSRFIPNWTFGIQEQALAELLEQIKETEKPDAIVLLSHNGMDVDLKLASRVTGIDFILGGHTHDGVPVPIEVKNSGGVTVVTNAGSNGKFLGVLDIEFGQQGMSGYRYRLMPVFSNLLAADKQMSDHIQAVQAPYLEKLQEPLAVTDSLLYRRGNFNGTFDQVICDALREQLDAAISLSPGFRWGTSILPGETITMEQLLDQTCMTYPETYVREMGGDELKTILESVADNLFHEDPYLQQGGDMVRTGGVNYTLDPTADMGKRISDLSLHDGTAIKASATYKVAGWATVGSKSAGEPVWDVVGSYLKDRKEIRLERLETPNLVGVKENAGIEQYRGKLS